MASPERPARRDFLKGASALVLGAIVPKGAKSAESEPKQAEHKDSPEQLKDRNTTIELEKMILNSFGASDMDNIASGPIPEKIFDLSRKYREEGAETVIGMFGTALLASLAYGLLQNQDKDKTASKDEEEAKSAKIAAGGAGAMGTLLMGATAVKAWDFFHQPSMKNIMDAEKEVVAWIGEYKMEKRLSVQEAIKYQLKKLTDEQKEIIDKLPRGNAI